MVYITFKLKIVLAVCLLQLAHGSVAQQNINLVLNGGFEKLISGKPENWYNPSRSSKNISTPDIWQKKEDPCSGHFGTTLIGIYSNFESGRETFEYYTGSISETLVPGEFYKLIFYYSHGQPPCEKENRNAHGSVNASGLGIFFSQNIPEQASYEQLNYVPQVTINPRYNETLDLIQCSLVFKATEASKYFTVGYFPLKDRVIGISSKFCNETETNNCSKYNYLYLDNFSISKTESSSHETRFENTPITQIEETKLIKKPKQDTLSTEDKLKICADTIKISPFVFDNQEYRYFNTDECNPTDILKHISHTYHNIYKNSFSVEVKIHVTTFSFGKTGELSSGKLSSKRGKTIRKRMIQWGIDETDIVFDLASVSKKNEGEKTPRSEIYFECKSPFSVLEK